MKRTTGKYVSLLLALVLALGLTACGGGGTAGGGEPDLEAVVDPAEIEWGYQADDSDDAQYWYPDGDKQSDYYLIFEDDFVTVDDGGNRTRFSTDIADGHVVNYNEEDPAMDFVFTDSLTCYDLKDGQWYMRADRDEATASLTAAPFVCEAGAEWTITFSADGTYRYDCDGTLMEGDWWFQDARTIEYNDDYGTTRFTITYADDNWEIVSIRDTDNFYPEG